MSGNLGVTAGSSQGGDWQFGARLGGRKQRRGEDADDELSATDDPRLQEGDGDDEASQGAPCSDLDE